MTLQNESKANFFITGDVHAYLSAICDGCSIMKLQTSIMEMYDDSVHVGVLQCDHQAACEKQKGKQEWVRYQVINTPRLNLKDDCRACDTCLLEAKDAEKHGELLSIAMFVCAGRGFCTKGQRNESNRHIRIADARAKFEAQRRSMMAREKGEME